MSKKFSATKPTAPSADTVTNGNAAVKTEPIEGQIAETSSLVDQKPTNEPDSDTSPIEGNYPINRLVKNSAKLTITISLSAKPPLTKATAGDGKQDGHAIDLDNELEELEDPDLDFHNSIADVIASSTAMGACSALGSLIGESMRGKSGSDDIVILPPSDNQLFIKSISPDISREELENVRAVPCFLFLAPPPCQISH